MAKESKKKSNWYNQKQEFKPSPVNLTPPPRELGDRGAKRYETQVRTPYQVDENNMFHQALPSEPPRYEQTLGEGGSFKDGWYSDSEDE